MSQYKKLDLMILNSVEQRTNPLYSRSCCEEADRIANATGRESFRVIDGRLQALRKAGKIRYMTKAENNGKGGWNLIKQY